MSCLDYSASSTRDADNTFTIKVSSLPSHRRASVEDELRKRDTREAHDAVQRQKVNWSNCQSRLLRRSDKASSTAFKIMDAMDRNAKLVKGSDYEPAMSYASMVERTRTYWSALRSNANDIKVL